MKKKESMEAHEVLGVDDTASQREITSAYFRLALQWHPDRHARTATPDEIEKNIKPMFQKIADAYSKLQPSS